MGLTVHYDFSIKENSVRLAKSLLNQIRQKAMDLPFHSVTEIFERQGDECDIEKLDRKTLSDDMSWVLCGVGANVTLEKRGNTTMSIRVAPKRMIGFTVLVGPGSEPLNFVFAQYPNTVLYPPKSEVFYWRKSYRYRVNRPGWSGGGFTKTQYASEPECGGVENFLRCHISVISLLEYAQSLPGMTLTINDEGKYGTSYYTDEPYAEERVYTWHDATHDPRALVKEVGEWNEMIAAGFGAFKDAIQAAGGNPNDLVGPIQNFSDREHLEAKGVAAQPEIRTNLGLTA
jgi:hypothetical protein